MSPLLELRQAVYKSLGYFTTRLRSSANGLPKHRADNYPITELLPESSFAPNLELIEKNSLGDYFRSRIGALQPAVGIAHLTNALVNTEHGWVATNATLYDNLNRAIAFRDYGSPAFRTSWSKPTITLTEPHFLLATHHSGNYYHWLLEALPRLLLYLENNNDLPRILTPARTAFQRDFLSHYKGILFSDFTVLDDKSLYACKSLKVVSLPIIPGNPSPAILRLIEQRLTAILPEHPPIRHSQTVLISRARSRFRKIINEDSLLRSLAPYGVERVFLEDLPLLEQILLFRQAKTIIAPHGAGLANLVFAQPNTRLIEIFPRCYLNQCYASFAAVKNFSYQPIKEYASPASLISLLRKGRYNIIMSDASIDAVRRWLT